MKVDRVCHQSPEVGSVFHNVWDDISRRGVGQFRVNAELWSEKHAPAKDVVFCKIRTQFLLDPSTISSGALHLTQALTTTKKNLLRNGRFLINLKMHSLERIEHDAFMSRYRP